MNLTCYRVREDAPELIPARAARAWMEEPGRRFANRCTPLVMANSTGWELLCPFGLTASWNGGPEPGDLVIEPEGSAANLVHFAQSKLGHGVLTFDPGYLFRTDPEWAIWCRGAPNALKDGITALEGLVETDWLPFTFSINWKFTRPGTVRFEKDEAFCFILPMPHLDIETIAPTVRPLSENPELEAEYTAWATARRESENRPNGGDPASAKREWQRFYFNGTSPSGEALAPHTHRIERRMAEAKETDPAGTAPSAPAVASGQRVPAPARVAQNIIWIASYPKSGNTWVRTFIHNLLKEVSGGDDDAQDINKLNEHTMWETPAVRYEQILGKPIAEASQAEIARARPEVQLRLARGRSGPFFVKTHLCLGNDHRYPTINLDATLAAIYIVRNPMDVAISYSHHSGQPVASTIFHMAMPGLKTHGREKGVYEVMGSWSQHVASWMGMTGRPVHLMRYEDLLGNPERSFGALARFLRLAPSEEQLKRAIAKSSFSELRKQEEERGFKERPEAAQQFFREGRSGQWPQALTQQQIADICSVHAPIMQRFGYLLADCGRSVAVTKTRPPARVE
jgi:hypothetical protein